MRNHIILEGHSPIKVPKKFSELSTNLISDIQRLSLSPQKGGEIRFQGSIEKVLKSPGSILSGRSDISSAPSTNDEQLDK